MSAFAKASGSDRSAPITSPVDRISGPRITSTPGNLLNGKTDSFTAKKPESATSSIFNSTSEAPIITLAAMCGHGTPFAFETNGAVRDARGFTSRM